MIGSRAGEPRRALDRVQPIHFEAALSPCHLRRDPPAIDELAGVPQAARHAGQKFGVERQHDIGLVEVVDRFDVFAERQFGAGSHIVPSRPARTGATWPRASP